MFIFADTPFLDPASPPKKARKPEKLRVVQDTVDSDGNIPNIFNVLFDILHSIIAFFIVKSIFNSRIVKN